MSSLRLSFSKPERLCSRKIIDELFSKQHTQVAGRYPLLAIWRFRPLPAEVPAQILISIPKRKFRKAVDRNRIRRQLREIYRLNKKLLYDFLLSQRLQCAIVIVYTANESLPYHQLEDAFHGLVTKIVEAAAKAS